MFHIHQLENIIPLRTDIKKREYNFNHDELLEIYSVYCNKNYYKLKELLNPQKDYNTLLIEDLEGVALYVEYKYLEKYPMESKNYLTILMDEAINLRRNLIPYIKGLLICLILDNVNSEWHATYNKGELLIHEILIEMLKETKG